jgi:hypothetical protein
MNPGVGPSFGFGRGGGRGFGRGVGGGRGWRHRYYATGLPGWARGRYFAPVQPVEEPYDSEFNARQEKAYLKAQLKQYRRSLDEIKRRLEELETEPTEEDS